MSKQYQNKVVMITGAAAGIGRAMALQAAAQGAKLILGDAHSAGLAETVGALKVHNVAVHAAHCDVTVQGDIDKLVREGEAALGPIDTLFANAGILGSPSDTWAYPEDEFRKVMEVNVTGTWRQMRAVMPGMVERQSGTVVLTASAGGVIGAPGLSAYCASKHAVVGLARTAAIEAGKHGIRVNALCPGMTDTAMLDRVENELPGLREALMTMNPSGRVANAEEVARAALWLGSGESTFVNGHPLVIDGGMVAQ